MSRYFIIMSNKLVDFRVEDVLGDGKYKVRHKVSDAVFVWQAHDCGYYSNEQIQNICNEVRNLALMNDDNVLRYYDIIHHAPAKVLYFVLEFSNGRNLEDYIDECVRENMFFSEVYLWRILHGIAKASRAVCGLKVSMMKKCISAASVFLDSGNLKVDCFSLNLKDTSSSPEVWLPICEIGHLMYRLCYLEHFGVDSDNELNFKYSDDMKSILRLMLNRQNSSLKPDSIIFHPTVQINVNKSPEGDVLLSNTENRLSVICKTPVRSGSHVNFRESLSPNYVNWSNLKNKDADVLQTRILSPNLSALALELPGFRPKMSQMNEFRDPQQVTEDVLNYQWLNRLRAIRDREEALNRRERELIDREIANSPVFEMALLKDESQESADNEDIAVLPALTLQPIMSHKALPLEIESKRTSLMDHTRNSKSALVPKKPPRRSTSLRSKNRRKKIYSYEDLDSSLSACDASVVHTTAKLSSEIMPRPSILEQRKKVHFTHNSNPFVEYLDVSGTKYTFYELENVDRDGYQVPRKQEFTSQNLADEIAKFKYLDLEKMTCEKRSAMDSWTKSSPKKISTSMENLTKPVLADITNGVKNHFDQQLLKVPSRMSISSKMSSSSTATKSSKTSKCSNSSQADSLMSFHSCIPYNTRSSTSIVKSDTSLASKVKASNKENKELKASPAKKTKSRKSLLPFKTPFKFR